MLISLDDLSLYSMIQDYLISLKIPYKNKIHIGIDNRIPHKQPFAIEPSCSCFIIFLRYSGKNENCKDPLLKNLPVKI